jgi:hypothetical protein
LQITAEDILNSAGRIEEVNQPLPESDLVSEVVQPALAAAEHCFSSALREITVAYLVRQALNVRPSALFRRP